MMKWCRGLLTVILVLFSFSSLWAGRVPAKGVVIPADGIILRGGPGNSFPEKETLPQGTVVTITGFTGRWYKVDAGELHGYCFTKSIRVTDYTTVDDEEAAQRPWVTLEETDPARPETNNPDPRIVPQSQ